MKYRINDMDVESKQGEMIIDTAKRYGIDIPHLCMSERLERIGACRLCVIEIEGQQKLFASCTTPPREGMQVYTHSPKVLNARRMNMELLLANHHDRCLTCSQNTKCKLQRYAEELMINDIRFKGEKRVFDVDESSVSIQRDNNKCILCGQCIRVCNDVQTVHAIGQQNRGFQTKVSPPFDLGMGESNCVNCGQCVVSCPTGALSEKRDIHPMIDAMKSGKILIAQTAPSIRATLGECFGMRPGTLVTGKMVTALRKLGFDYVFDTDFAADVTIVEEAKEFVKRFKEKRDLPMITTCCPAWIKFGEQFFFEQLNHMSSCKSPQAIMGSLVKTYFANKLGKKSSDIVLVDIMPCTAKKFEIQRKELIGETDFVLTTIELAALLKQFNIDFENLDDGTFDNPLGESTGAGTIFGKSGGVMEAALRSAVDFISGKELKQVDYKQVRGMKTMKEAELKIGSDTIRICVVHTLGEARKIMDQIREGKSPYHFIEIMSCYGGCIGGGGQPKLEDYSVLKARTKALVDADKKMKYRKSHKNPSVLKIYKEYLGEFGGKKAHKLLHTKYFQRECL